MTSASMDHEKIVRAAVFDYLSRLVVEVGEVLPWARLTHGFEYEGTRVPLVSQNGIFKPAILTYPISLRTAPPRDDRARPYDDELGEGTVGYAFRDSRTANGRADNGRLARAAELGLPLVYFFGVVKGHYLAEWPVYVDEVDAHARLFRVHFEERGLAGISSGSDPTVSLLREDGPEALGRRRCVTRSVVQRMHQAAFRDRVLRAYKEHCAICRLRHAELLDAAHIRPDCDGGEPVVSNGLALCKLHHAAFDATVLGVRPDLVVEIRPDVLVEEDGPMLRHGLQSVHGTRILVPRRASHRPLRELLEERYERFRLAQ